MQLLTTIFLVLLPLIDAAGFSPTGATQVSSELQNKFSLYFKYAAVSYCSSIVKQKTFTCGSRCNDPVVQGTTVEQVVTDPNVVYQAMVFVNSNSKTIIVGFKGTNQFQNFIADWQMRLVTPQGFTFPPNVDSPKIHNGFQLNYGLIKDDLFNAVKSAAINYPDYNIVFTGHSLGGSIAQLAIVNFHQSGLVTASRLSLYTYGQPRVGNQAWARYVNSLPFASRMYRLAGEKDPIVNFIPTQIGYEHSTQQFLVKNDGTTFTCANNSPLTGESNPCLLNPVFGNVNGHLFYYNLGVDSAC